MSVAATSKLLGRRMGAENADGQTRADKREGVLGVVQFNTHCKDASDSPPTERINNAVPREVSSVLHGGELRGLIRCE